MDQTLLGPANTSHWAEESLAGWGQQVDRWHQRTPRGLTTSQEGQLHEIECRDVTVQACEVFGDEASQMG